MTLPAELTFVSATPAPSATGPALHWDLGNLPENSESGEIIIDAVQAFPLEFGTTLMVTANISTTTPEVETANNTVLAPIRIAYSLYLPLIHAGEW